MVLGKPYRVKFIQFKGMYRCMACTGQLLEVRGILVEVATCMLTNYVYMCTLM